MPKHNRHIRLFAAMLGLGIMSATGSIRTRHVNREKRPAGAERWASPQCRYHRRLLATTATNLDDWYYDFYDSPDIPC